MFIRNVIWIISILFTLSYTSFAQDSDDSENQSPNILFITIDNVGYGDLPPFNDESPIVAPNLDRLASEGARLTDFYTAGITCAPSRGALLTGRVPNRNKLTWQLPGLDGNYGIGLPQSEVIIPRMLEQSAPEYATGAFGKWNIGFAPGSRPTERGFDEFLGHASGNIDYWTHIYEGQDDMYHGTESINRKGEYTTDIFADAATDFIRSKTDDSEPWFVYLPFNAPHRPASKNVTPDEPTIRQAPDYAFDSYSFSPDEAESHERFYAQITAIDFALGRVLETLDELGIAENTFVFFFSDNGAFTEVSEEVAQSQSNAPFRGGGTTLWEGGVRVPAFARWPGRIEANSVIDTPLWSPDLFVAAARLAGAQLPQDRFIDGKDPLPVLTGQTNQPPHTTLFFKLRGQEALRWGDWKIMREDPENSWQLFNLREDNSETQDLASERPELVQRLSGAFNSKCKEIGADLQREADTLDINKLPLRLRQSLPDGGLECPQ